MIRIDRHPDFNDGWVLQCEQRLPRLVADVWPFFSDAFNLEAITPDYLRFKVLTPAPIDMRVGTIIDYTLKLHGVPFKWRTEITAWEPPHRFVDTQAKGPYLLWQHEHRFEDDGEGGTRAIDRVAYRIPGGPLAPLVHRAMVKRDVTGVFAYRHDWLAKHFAAEPGATGAAGETADATTVPVTETAT